MERDHMSELYEADAGISLITWRVRFANKELKKMFVHGDSGEIIKFDGADLTHPQAYKKIPALRALLLMGIVVLGGCGQICSKEPTLNSLMRDLQQLVYFDEQNVCDMEFGNPGPKLVGIAAIAPYVRCDITIKTGLPPYQLRATAYHEIAHCLGIDHDYGRGYSIMSPNVATEYHLKENWGQLVGELREILHTDL